MQRRFFVQLAAFTAAAVTLPLLTGCGNHLDQVETQPEFFSRIADIKMIKASGQAYLLHFKNEGSAEKLKTLLMDQVNQNNNVDNIRDALVAKTIADFKINQIVNVNGWFLARTEARQCALYYLLNS